VINDNGADVLPTVSGYPIWLFPHKKYSIQLSVPHGWGDSWAAEIKRAPRFIKPVDRSDEGHARVKFRIRWSFEMDNLLGFLRQLFGSPQDELLIVVENRQSGDVTQVNIPVHFVGRSFFLLLVLLILVVSILGVIGEIAWLVMGACGLLGAAIAYWVAVASPMRRNEEEHAIAKWQESLEPVQRFAGSAER